MIPLARLAIGARAAIPITPAMMAADASMARASEPTVGNCDSAMAAPMNTMAIHTSRRIMRKRVRTDESEGRLSSACHGAVAACEQLVHDARHDERDDQVEGRLEPGRLRRTATLTAASARRWPHGAGAGSDGSGGWESSEGRRSSRTSYSIRPV